MAVDFRPDLMTKGIVYCLRSECSRSTSCLRHLAYKYAKPFFHHSFIDPRNTTVGDRCPEYLSNQVQLMGRGFKASMRLVQHGSISDFRRRISYELECSRSLFYRYSSGKQLLTMTQQAIVRSVFEEFGVTKEDLFDTYEDAYYMPY